MTRLIHPPHINRQFLGKIEGTLTNFSGKTRGITSQLVRHSNQIHWRLGNLREHQGRLGESPTPPLILFYSVYSTHAPPIPTSPSKSLEVFRTHAPIKAQISDLFSVSRNNKRTERVRQENTAGFLVFVFFFHRFLCFCFQSKQKQQHMTCIFFCFSFLTPLVAFCSENFDHPCVL